MKYINIVFFFYNLRNSDNSIVNTHLKSLHQQSVKKSHESSLLKNLLVSPGKKAGVVLRKIAHHTTKSI